MPRSEVISPSHLRRASMFSGQAHRERASSNEHHAYVEFDAGSTHGESHLYCKGLASRLVFDFRLFT